MKFSFEMKKICVLTGIMTISCGIYGAQQTPRLALLKTDGNVRVMAAESLDFKIEEDEIVVSNRDESHRFELKDLVKMYYTSDATDVDVSNGDVASNTVVVTFSGDEAGVEMDARIAEYVKVDISGAKVSVTQSTEVTDSNCGEIRYVLQGDSSDGSFSMTGSYKSTVELNGLNLTSTMGAAVDIQNGKRIKLIVADGTTNTLTDCVNGTQKGCLACKGHLEIQGAGTLNVCGHSAHAIYAKEYVKLKETNVAVCTAVKDGLNCNQYFEMKSGMIDIEGIGDDGIQVSFKDDTDRESEDTGSILISGGKINVSASATGGKGMKAEGDLTVNDGTINVEATGSGGEGIESKGMMTINGGEISIYSNDDGMNSGGHMYIKGGSITAIATNNDGIDSNGNLYIEGGVIRAFGSSSPECGIDANEEEGYTVIFTGGMLLAVGGGNSTPSSTESTQAYVSGNLTLNAGEEVTLKSGDEILATFVVPENYVAGTGGFGGGFGRFGGRPGGGSQGGSVLVSCEGLTAGSTYTLVCGSSSATVTAQTKGSSNGGFGRPW